MNDSSNEKRKKMVSFDTRADATTLVLEEGSSHPLENYSSQVEGAVMPPLKPIIKPPALRRGGDTLASPRWPEVSHPTSMLKQALKDLINSAGFDSLPETAVLAMLKGYAQQHEPHVSPSTYTRTEELPDYQPQARKISLATRTLLEQISQLEATVPLSKNPQTGNRPLVGLIAYIGSPLDGEMVIANESIVSDWVTFTRNAVKENLVHTEGGLLTSEMLAQIVNVRLVPEGRHSFTVTYGEPPPCVGLGHARFKWDSARYPCSISSCRSYAP